VGDIAMVKIGCNRIDFGCNCVVVLQPHLRLLHLVVTITTGLLGCDSYMLIATRTLIAEAKVVLHCNAVLGLQLLPLIATRTLGGEAKVVLSCNALLVLQLLYDYCNKNSGGRSKSGSQLQHLFEVAMVTCLLQRELGAEADLDWDL
jgi:hypothetical protein